VLDAFQFKRHRVLGQAGTLLGGHAKDKSALLLWKVCREDDFLLDSLEDGVEVWV
jgi:hypothetical protein